ALTLATRRGAGRQVPRRRLPSDHREDRPGAHLRRLPRPSARPNRVAHIRRWHPAARLPAAAPRRPASPSRRQRVSEPDHPSSTQLHRRIIMAATYTWDVFSTLDGYGSYNEHGDWGGYWGKQGPELLDHRLAQYSEDLRLVLGANTYRVFAHLLAAEPAQSDVYDNWVTRMRHLPTTVVSNTLAGPLVWPDVTLVPGGLTDAVARLKAESDIPLRSHGSLAINRALMAAGLVDAIQVTIFPVVSGCTGAEPIFRGAVDFDLELLESRTFDRNIQQLT